MYCKKCGAQVGEGEKFCSACGDKIEVLAPAGQDAVQPNEQQPYGQQSYGQPPYGQPPYGQPPYGQPPSQPPKKSKAALWAVIGALAVLAIAALLIFVVFPGVLGQPVSGLLSGNTPQERFVNDAAKVFSGAFEGMGSDTFDRLAKEPFEISYDFTVDMPDMKLNMAVDAAYDEQTLGISMDTMGIKTKVLLLEDILYQSSDTMFGASVTGVDFGSKADLKKPMSLEDRIKAIVQGIAKQEDTKTQIDFVRLAEMLVNSIDESCFEKSTGKWTLTLEADDIRDMMETLSDKLKADKDMLHDLEDYIYETSGTTVDVIEALNTAKNSLGKGNADFKLVWELFYKGDVPVGVEISYQDSSTKFKILFEYEKIQSGADIDFKVTADGSVAVTGNMSYKKTSDGIEYELSITAGGETLKMTGSEETKDGKITGSIALNIPDAGEVNLKYEGALKFKKPSKSVKDDDRFSVDTKNAVITDAAGAFGMLGLQGSTSFEIPPIIDDPTPLPDYDPGDSNGAQWELEGTLWESETASMYFYYGYIYFGQPGMSGQEILSAGSDVYAYMFDGLFIDVTFPDGTAAQWFYDGKNIWAGETMFYKAG